MRSKYHRLAAAAFACTLCLIGCGSSETTAPPSSSPYGPFAGLSFGADSTFEIVTWNIQNFPKEDATTTTYVAQAIAALDVDVVALQEIESAGDFNRVLLLLDKIGQWSGYRAATSAYELNLALIYQDSSLSITAGPYEILENEWFGLPRNPLVIECVFDTTPLVIIDNHFKALGGEENEARRRQGSQLLEAWIDENFPDTAVILLGDLNDELTDLTADNVFQGFLDRPDDFLFTDMGIAVGDETGWSYPGWPSHIDHIMITDELFAAFADPGAEVRTLLLENHVPSYFSDISDHRPVGLKLPLN